MFYTTDDNGNDVELYEDNIFTYCPDCGCKVYPDKEELVNVVLNHDLAGTTMYCRECGDKRRREARP